MADVSVSPPVSYEYVPSPFPGCPAFIFHLTHFTNTLFVWVGTGTPTSIAADGEGGSKDLDSRRRLASEWAVAMPSSGNIPASATSLFRSGATDTAPAMSQRLAKRFPGNQVHLSLSLPASLTSPSGQNLDPYASKAMLVLEKKLCKWLDTVVATKN